ncbi:MAG: adenine deaminase [Deltaproteobacteria bacterium]|nr:adenine deaminase [Deltaproteobacteria bacterium]
MDSLTHELIAVARGDRPANLLLKDARIVNVFSGKVEKGSVAIYKDRIAGIGEYRAKRVIDLDGLFLSPGLIDSHIHIESTMLCPSEFARVVVPRGTTTVIIDPHEIANVLGVKGIRYFLEAGISLPIDIHIMLPSCVPATPLETSGARLTARSLRPFLRNKNALGLAEVMNYHGVVGGDKDLLMKIGLCYPDSPIDGHAPGLSGKKLNAYIAPGISSDHESTEAKEAEEKMRKGVFIMIREGTTEKNLDVLLPLVAKANSRRFAFVSDDRHPIDLLNEGHLDDILRKAVKRGLDPVIAIQLITINPAEHFGLKGIGAIAPGYRADMVVFKDLKGFMARMVFKAGRLVARDGRVLKGAIQWQKTAPGDSIKVDWKRVGGIGVRAWGRRIKVIQVFPGQIVTQKVVERPRVVGGMVVSETGRDILKVVVIERHRGTGNVGVGFVRGFGLKKGGMASSVAHDSHNIVAVGVNDGDILMAAKRVVEMGGGLTVVSDGRVLASLPLPIAGLMSDRPLEEVVKAMEGVLKAARRLGCKLPDPFMTMSFLALPVIPEIRLTDKGLVDVERFEVVSVFS